MREIIYSFKSFQSVLRERLNIEKLPLNNIDAVMGMLTITHVSLIEDKVTASMLGLETDFDIELLDDVIIKNIIIQMKNFIKN
jgi:hypothetical protein